MSKGHSTYTSMKRRICSRAAFLYRRRFAVAVPAARVCRARRLHAVGQHDEHHARHGEVRHEIDVQVAEQAFQARDVADGLRQRARELLDRRIAIELERVEAAFDVGSWTGFSPRPCFPRKHSKI